MAPRPAKGHAMGRADVAANGPSADPLATASQSELLSLRKRRSAGGTFRDYAICALYRTDGPYANGVRQSVDAAAFGRPLALTKPASIES